MYSIKYKATGDRFFTKETILEIVESENHGLRSFFGDIILKSLGYNAYCEDLRKTRDFEDCINIIYVLSNDNMYIKTFFIDEILEKMKRKKYEFSVNIGGE